MRSLLLFLFLLFYFDYCYFSVHDNYHNSFLCVFLDDCLFSLGGFLDRHKQEEGAHALICRLGSACFQHHGEQQPLNRKKKKTKIMDLVIILLIAFEH